VIEICEENETQCTETGNYTSTASSITIDSGTADATTFSYTLNGNTMTWTGSIDGTPAEVEMQRAS
jgi:hypothetical protein